MRLVMLPIYKNKDVIDKLITRILNFKKKDEAKGIGK